MTSFEEGELQLSFGDEWDAEHFDRPGVSFPQGVSPVDFIAEGPDELVLVEVKDPFAAQVPTRHLQDFVEKMKSKELTHQELAPKARTSYGFLHLMARDTKPMRYVVVIATERLSLQPPLMTELAERLRARLAQEADTPWKRTYISDCNVVSVEDLGKALPGCSASRMAAYRVTTQEQST